MSGVGIRTKSGQQVTGLAPYIHIVNEEDLREAIRRTQAYLDIPLEEQGTVLPPKEQHRMSTRHTDKKRTQ
jgi:hypothetical protein